jgi:hypothetical protein
MVVGCRLRAAEQIVGACGWPDARGARRSGTTASASRRSASSRRSVPAACLGVVTPPGSCRRSPDARRGSASAWPSSPIAATWQRPPVLWLPHQGHPQLVMCRGFGDPVEGGLSAGDFVEDLVGGFGPDEGLGVVVQWETQQSIRVWRSATEPVYPIGGTLAKCDPFGTPSTSHWTGAAIIVQSPRTKTCIVTRSRTSTRPMPFSLAG